MSQYAIITALCPFFFCLIIIIIITIMIIIINIIIIIKTLRFDFVNQENRRRFFDEVRWLFLLIKVSEN